MSKNTIEIRYRVERCWHDEWEAVDNMLFRRHRAACVHLRNIAAAFGRSRLNRKLRTNAIVCGFKHYSLRVDAWDQRCTGTSDMDVRTARPAAQPDPPLPGSGPGGGEPSPGELRYRVESRPMTEQLMPSGPWRPVDDECFAAEKLAHRHLSGCTIGSWPANETRMLRVAPVPAPGTWTACGPMGQTVLVEVQALECLSTPLEGDTLVFRTPASGPVWETWDTFASQYALIAPVPD